MNKKQSTYLNMTISLGLVALIASAALGYVYEITKEPIAAAKLAKKERSIKAVVPEYANNPLEDMVMLKMGDNQDSLECYKAYNGDQLTGVAIRAQSPNGYSGAVWVMVGLLPDGTIHNAVVLEHRETPGLGSKMSDPAFKDQFQGKDPDQFNLQVEKDGGDVDAITGATISSRAFAQAVEKACQYYKSWREDDTTREP